MKGSNRINRHSGNRGRSSNYGGQFGSTPLIPTGVCVIVFSIGLRRQLPSRWTAKVGSILLMVGALGLIGAGVFQCNQGCRNILIEPDLVGRLHIIVSMFAGMGTGLAPFFIWAAMRGNGRWKAFVTPTLVAAVLANVPGIVLWFTVFADLRLHAVEGIIQRMGFIVVLIWIFYVAARLWRCGGPSGRRR